MTKGEDTKNKILCIALDMSSRLGLDVVSIGTLAKAAGMSKSGLFAHFQSKEKLQIELLTYAGQHFFEQVVQPALIRDAGIPRIRALVENWGQWVKRMTGGCIFVQAANDFMDRPGKVQDFLINQQRQWIDSLKRMAISGVRVGHFRRDIDAEKFAFELYSLLLGFHLYFKLLKDDKAGNYQLSALDALLQNYQ